MSFASLFQQSQLPSLHQSQVIKHFKGDWGLKHAVRSNYRFLNPVLFDPPINKSGRQRHDRIRIYKEMFPYSQPLHGRNPITAFAKNYAPMKLPAPHGISYSIISDLPLKCKVYGRVLQRLSTYRWAVGIHGFIAVVRCAHVDIELISGDMHEFWVLDAYFEAGAASIQVSLTEPVSRFGIASGADMLVENIRGSK